MTIGPLLTITRLSESNLIKIRYFKRISINMLLVVFFNQMLTSIVLAVTIACAVAQPWNFTTPLDEYVALPDPTYTYYDTV